MVRCSVTTEGHNGLVGVCFSWGKFTEIGMEIAVPKTDVNK